MRGRIFGQLRRNQIRLRRLSPKAPQVRNNKKNAWLSILITGSTLRPIAGTFNVSRCESFCGVDFLGWLVARALIRPRPGENLRWYDTVLRAAGVLILRTLLLFSVPCGLDRLPIGVNLRHAKKGKKNGKRMVPAADLRDSATGQNLGPPHCLRDRNMNGGRPKKRFANRKMEPPPDPPILRWEAIPASVVEFR